ncbi:MAG: hypothetical protein KJ963_01075 [Bacteroidetes bacterium]|nr:hypothetical protein [Bacteroidota bacterium]MBU1422537.1 hypothetical protein [Bacteroidota bacterium]MBU2635670.1 hypothetical protein [Bacteroidota bacterium]
MDEKTALDELQFIRKIIEDSKKTVLDDGIGYIFWGIIIVVGLFTTNILIISKVYFNYLWIWLIVIGIGWTYSIISSRRKKERLPRTFGQKLIHSVWISIGIGMTLLGLVGPAVGAYKGFFISPILSVLLGSAFFISGFIYDLKWVKLLSIGWWIGAVVMFIYPGMHSFIIMGSLMIFFQIIPGIILYRKYKREAKVQS